MAEEPKKKIRTIQVKGGWDYDIRTRGIFYVPDQYIDEDKQFADANSGPGSLQIEFTIPYHAYESLVDFIAKREKGVLRTDREEDLKLIHRLLDVLTKSIEHE